MPGRDHLQCGVVTKIEGTQKNKKFFRHVGVVRFYSPKNKQDVLSWARAINRIPLFMKGYDCEEKPQRPAPKIRNTEISEEKTRKRR